MKLIILVVYISRDAHLGHICTIHKIVSPEIFSEKTTISDNVPIAKV